MVPTVSYLHMIIASEFTGQESSVIEIVCYLQSNFNGSNIFGTIEIFVHTWVLRATEV